MPYYSPWVAVHRVIINGGGSPCTVAFLWRLHLELKLVRRDWFRNSGAGGRSFAIQGS